jgi:N-acetylglucosaminyldiphosphoundecaprenol N-acetyl-beta-D-mannosaminyltransferase
MNLLISDLDLFNTDLENLPDSKLLINTINAHSFNTAQIDKLFCEAILNSDILLPDGISIVLASRFIYGRKLKKIAGSELFFYEMNRLNRKGGKCFFLGSNRGNLKLIIERAKIEYPNVKVDSFSPSFNKEFSIEENTQIITIINSFKPDVLFIGMSAPKQEKWAYQHFKELDVNHICSIGAVFNYYSRRINRAPESIIKIGLEWLHRLIKEPRRLWRRYLIGNAKFLYLILKEKLVKSKSFD